MAPQRSFETAFLSHMLRYVGIGLISGSVVHLGTLGGGYLRYAILILMGAVLFAYGTWVEHRDDKQANIGAYLLFSIIVSIGTGMVSGATQHYLDGPRFAAVLLPVGLGMAYFAFGKRDGYHLTLRRIATIASICLIGLVILLFVAELPALESLGHS